MKTDTHQFSASFFCLFLVGWAASAGKPPSSAALPVPPNVAHIQLRGAASYHSRQQHATSMSWCMGSSSSVDAMLTCPRPLLCCCSGPSGTAPVQVCVGSAFPPFYPPSISLCVRVLCHALGGARAYLPATMLHAWSCLVSRRRR